MSRSTLARPNLAPIFASLRGTWALSRVLNSHNPTDPSGTVSGTAKFTPLHSRAGNSAVHGGQDHDDAGLQDLLYTEEGSMTLANDGPTMRFTRKYIWRLACSSPQSVRRSAGQQPNPESKLSVWFVKPGTDQELDYLFHELSAEERVSQNGEGKGTLLIAEGDHLCVEDMYETSYSFDIDPETLGEHGAEGQLVREWQVVHIVKGPKKEQRIESWYKRV